MGNTDPRVAIKTLAAIISKLIQNIDTRVTLAQTSANANLAKSANLSDVAARQTALNNLANAIQASTNEFVLTKDTATGNIILKAVASSDVSGKMDKSANLSDVASKQTALNNLANAIQANTNEYVLTKDTATGNIILKAVAIPDVSGKMDKSANLSDVAARQTALNNLSNASQASTNEFVLTKDTATGNIILKASAGGSSGNLVQTVAMPISGWAFDGTYTDFYSKTVTITGPLGVNDIAKLDPLIVGTASRNAWYDMALVRADRVSDTSIKLYAIAINTYAFNFELKITKG